MQEIDRPTFDGESTWQATHASEPTTIGKREHAGRNALPVHLPRKEEIVAVEAQERKCPCCGGERHVIGYEEKEVLDLEPLRYFVRVSRARSGASTAIPASAV